MSVFRILAEKSWLTPSVAGETDDLAVGVPPEKTGLAFFMAVMSSMFFLFVVGYRMRMMQPDWQPIAEPGLLWANTAELIVASIMMHRAKKAAQDGRVAAVRDSLTFAGVFTIAFIVGQFVAWGILRDGGFYAVQNPATAFFLLLTGLHALHLFGGLVVWSRATFRAWQGVEVKRIGLSIDLCTTYWDYLLIVWFVFFTLLLLT
jgi:cytochrome c oxidase subunit 3